MFGEIRGKAYLLFWLALAAVLGAVYEYFWHDAAVGAVVETATIIAVLFFSVIIHEVCHGLGGLACGDATAKTAGRLTLNPINHVSIVGTIIAPTALYFINPTLVLGWARPVPFNPVKLRHFPRDQVFLALAGPLSNLVLAYFFFCLFLLSVMVMRVIFPEAPLATSVYMLTPDFLADLPGRGYWVVYFLLLKHGMIINAVLAVFNLLPIPPLDGSWLLKAVLPKKISVLQGRFHWLGLILILVAAQTGLLTILFYPVFVLIFMMEGLGGLVLAGLG